MREPVDLLIEPRWLVPLSGAATVLPGHALAVEAGRIVALGPAAQLRARLAPREHLQRPAHALLPGFISAHTRACRALLAAVAPFGTAARSRACARVPPGTESADFVRDGTRLAVAQMLRAGITCFADVSAHPEEAARIAAAAPIRACLGLPLAETESLTPQLERAARLWDEYRADARVSLFFAPQEPGSASDASLARVRRVADELEARVALELARAPAPDEVRDGGADTALEGAALLRRLAQLGFLQPGFAAVSAGGLDAGAYELIERHGAAHISCAVAPRGREPLRALAGERTGLGCGDPLASGALDVRAVARSAALGSGLSALAALRMATLGGATALGLHAQLGTLEEGKLADLACFKVDALAAASGSIPDALLFGGATVSDVWCAGRLAVCEERLLAFDPAELGTLAARWAQRLELGAAA